MRIFRYLLQHKGALALVIALLLVQAMCDLALPGYTASIVDTGIAQSGIDLDALYASYQDGALASDDPAAAVLSSYASLDAADAHERAQASQELKAAYERAGIDVDGMQLNYLLGVGGLMLLVTAIGALASILISFIASRTAATIARELRERLFSRVVSYSDAEIQRFSAASLITRGTNDIQQIQMVCMVSMRLVLFAPLMAIGGIVMVLNTDVKMSWIIVLAVFVALGCIVIIVAVAMPKFKMLQKLIDRVNLVAREILTGMPVIRAFNRQSYEQERFDEANATLMRTQLFTNRAMVFMMPTTQLVMNGVSALIVWVGAGYIDAGTLQTGQMIAFITYAMVIVTSFMILSMVAILLPRATVAAERVDEVLSCEPSIHDPESPRDEELPATGARIDFERVTFAYDDESEPVLRDVSFSVPPGNTCAFIGATGSGKSTIFKLLMRFYDVSQGAVKLDGIDVRELTQAGLHHHLGYVPQKSFLFSGTIGSNIAYSDAALPAADIERVARIAQAEEFILAREGAFESEVSQGGTNVSGGQRQRIAIARALATGARALLFDDSFSALDYATDAALRRQLSQQLAGTTVLIVAQRIATIRHADQIVVLDDGRVAGIGTHEQLLGSCGVYREIAASQLSPDELGGGA